MNLERVKSFLVTDRKKLKIKKIREKQRESKKAHGKGKEKILEKTI